MLICARKYAPCKKKCNSNISGRIKSQFCFYFHFARAPWFARCFYSFALSSYAAINKQQQQQQHQQSTWGCHTIATVTLTHWKSFLDGIFTVSYPPFVLSHLFILSFTPTCLCCVRLIAHLFKLTTVSIEDNLAKCFFGDSILCCERMCSRTAMVCM